MSRRQQPDVMHLIDRAKRGSVSTMGEFHDAHQVLSGVGLSYLLPEAEEKAAAHRFARRLANRHGCVIPALLRSALATRSPHGPTAAARCALALTQPCTVPGHTTDVAAALSALRLLGLAPEPAEQVRRDERGRIRRTAECSACGRMKTLRLDGRIGRHQDGDGDRCLGGDQPPTRRCTNCEQTKPHADFYADRRNGDGLNSWCKTCSDQARTTNREKEGTAA